MTTGKGQKVDLTFGPAIFLWISPFKEDSHFFLMKIIVSSKKFNQRYHPSISNSNGSSGSLCPTRCGTGAIYLMTRQGANAWQMPISQGPSSAQAQKPLIKGTMTPTSREMQQILQKHSKEPVIIL